MMRYSVRIKLTDFIDTEYEEQILASIYSIGEETGKSVFLKLWYMKDEITQERVAAFIKRYEKLLEDIGTNIHVGEYETWSTKSWFNIRRRGTPAYSEYRHEYLYTATEGIIEAVMVFRTVLKSMTDTQSVTTQSPPPQQRRENGYRVTIKKVPSVQK